MAPTGPHRPSSEWAPASSEQAPTGSNGCLLVAVSCSWLFFPVEVVAEKGSARCLTRVGPSRGRAVPWWRSLPPGLVRSVPLWRCCMIPRHKAKAGRRRQHEVPRNTAHPQSWHARLACIQSACSDRLPPRTLLSKCMCKSRRSKLAGAGRLGVRDSDIL